MSLQKEFIPYGLALRMKDLGFEEPSFVTIDQTGFMHLKGTEYPIRGSMVYHDVNVPTWQSAFRWFREKGWHCELIPHEESDKWSSVIYPFACMKEADNIGDFDSYEEAQEAALEKLIEIVEEI